MSDVLECVVNISEGRRLDVVDEIAAAGGRLVLDVHSDPSHHRSVLTLAGTGGAGGPLENAVRAVAAAAMARLDLREHAGVHPRLGVLDVVPFVALGSPPEEPASLAPAAAARDRFAAWAGAELGLPCFLYGAERSLVDVRRGAFVTLAPDTGPGSPHPTGGACAVGARGLLVAYNLWLRDAPVADARAIASRLRGPDVRALGLETGDAAQVSCNLINPALTGLDIVFDRVAAMAEIARAELVGLLPEAVLRSIAPQRWRELDLSPDRTIEARLRAAGLGGSS